MNTVHKIDRRDFLKTTGLTGTALVLGVPSLFTEVFGGEVGAAASFEPNAYIRIDEDGNVRLTVHRSEMGQGVRTSCAMLLADELAVDWKDVEIVQATGHPRFGNQNTDGSRSIRTHWEPLRRAGAAAREMLIAAGATSWGVAAAECYAEDSWVIHRTSGRRVGYGKLVARAAELPVPASPRLKSSKEFKIIGRPTTGLDVSDIAQGRAVYGWDVEIPGMLYACLARSPTVKGRVKAYKADAARALKGVRDVVQLDGHPSGFTNNAVAVVAENSWAATEGRKALKIDWDRGSEPLENSASFRSKLEAIAARPGRVIREEGDFDRAAAEADRVIEARYHGPYLVHAPMEPPVCTAKVEGDRCEVWAPTQHPQWARSMIAETLEIPPDNVTVNVTLLGGGFGRKSKPDFILEAVALSRKLGAPVKLFWTREDEVRHGFYRAQNFQTLRGTLDSDGRLTGWLHRTVFPSIASLFDPNELGPASWELAQGFTNMPYRIPNVRMEAGSIASDLRIGWWRSVCHTFHAFAVNSFIDELANATGRDPVKYHLALLGEPRILEFSDRDRESPYKFDTGRLSAVIEEAAKMANWGRKLPTGHGLGFAAHYSFLSYITMAIHASVDDAGELSVHEVDCAVDCGTVVNPDTVMAQMEGAVVYGLSAALYDQITVENGAVQQGNFDDYPMLRITKMPRVNVHLMPSDALPTGIGEPGVPPVAPALCNAIYAATGKRIRDLPLSEQKLG